ncbi:MULTISPECIES: hypothetical protein [Paraburkholderia]|jgi:hypothetical protein|uniref:MatE protein n=1 Tax=Paraburkholderia fungorum TaxID=134537 RepID=A0AAW3V0X8_9BURK|nr:MULTISPECIES: hypothetical protein [Paraburkholderia]KFX64393.1 hypothetical protein KBK24_0122450 [Burkholderia sp. K24]MBB4515442.1 hypothetical protein [Paraburkholderia fungorum]MBB6203385.1 hypothetical protein [Paraburkholderia fungorum]MDE1005325.1 hypothetical protein [Paraburkholderia fungorum]PNE56857.1 hypothetical protein A8H39_14135 [Paraburkholderia fungorum]
MAVLAIISILVVPAFADNGLLASLASGIIAIAMRFMVTYAIAAATQSAIAVHVRRHYIAFVSQTSII